MSQVSRWKSKLRVLGRRSILLWSTRKPAATPVFVRERPPERRQAAEAWRVLEGDSRHLLSEVADCSVDSVVTDPPYGISFMGKSWDYDVPSVEIWKEVYRVLKPGGHALVASGTRTQHRMVLAIEAAGFEIRDVIAWVYSSGFPKSLNVGKAVDERQGTQRSVVGLHQSPASSLYSQGREPMPESVPLTVGQSAWEGWGTALKPAMEFWTVCRKPLGEKTVATNVLKWGTGALNIDGCRVGGHEADDAQQGRFPANLIHDGSDAVTELFPGDAEASASRFFYCAKASRGERESGCEHLEDRALARSGGAQNAAARGADAYLADGFNRISTVKNHHPTVKPVRLMRYLCRLVTAPGGLVLDPFAGSGTTGVAAVVEGFQFMGMEREREYARIARARIGYAARRQTQSVEAAA